VLDDGNVKATDAGQVLVFTPVLLLMTTLHELGVAIIEEVLEPHTNGTVLPGPELCNVTKLAWLE
jgi:hypothetical protein